MYIPDIFKNEDEALIKEFIGANSFGILVSTISGKLWATHIPIEFGLGSDGRNILHGHLSKENPQWKDLEQQEVLAIFSGPDAYISSSWYDHENVPTWNYTAVHVYGKARLVDDAQKLRHLKLLVDKYEAASEKPVTVETLSEKTMMQIRGIAVFEIEISEIQATRKLSQNRDEPNHDNIVAELLKKEDPGAVAIALEMQQCRRPK